MISDDDEEGRGGSDRTPVGRAARALEMGAAGAKLASTLAQAGVRSLIGGRGARQQIWHEAHLTGAAELVASMGRLRGAAAKLGQLLAQRPGSLPDEYVEALLSLTNQAPPMSYGMVKTQLLSQLGRAPAELFARFERQPFAAASIGQVHRAWLADGRPLAVKVQYPAIADTLNADLENLQMLLVPLSRIGNWADIGDVVVELRERLHEELDYQREAASLARFAALFGDEPAIVVPAVHADCSTRKILTMDFVEGKSLSEYLAGDPPVRERDRFARLIVRFAWSALFQHRLAHVDPNPGNYLFRDDGTLGVVDFGCVKSFSAGFVGGLDRLLAAAERGDAAELDEALLVIGFVTPEMTAEQRLPFRRMSLAWARPFHSPRFDFGDRGYLQELVELQSIFLRRGPALRVPPDCVFFSRQVIGIAYLLHKLGASGRFAGVLRESRA